jgi:hypothetical protein
VEGVGVEEVIDFVFVGGGGDVVAVFAVIEVCFFAVAEAWVREGVLVLRVMRMEGRLYMLSQLSGVGGTRGLSF